MNFCFTHFTFKRNGGSLSCVKSRIILSLIMNFLFGSSKLFERSSMVFNYYEVEQHLTFSARNMGLKLENFNSDRDFCELRDLLLYSCGPWFKRLLLHFTS